MTSDDRTPSAMLSEQEAGSTFYVAADGNDGWSGKLPSPNPEGTDGPFASLRRARDAIRELKRAEEGLKHPASVLVRGGKYFLDRTLILTDEDSGTQECPVTYTAYSGEKPVLSGGRMISGWRPYRDNIVVCDLPGSKGGKWRTRQLFYDSQRMIRARWPKYDPQDPICKGWVTMEGSVEENSTREFRYRPGTFPRQWVKPTEAEVNVWPCYGWYNNIIPIKAMDEEKRIIILSHDVFSQDREPWFFKIEFRPGNRFYVENVLEELTTPGEWCQDAEEGTLYFWPPDDRIVHAEVVVPALDCLVSLRGASWITISGFTFTETTHGDDVHRAGLDGYGSMVLQQGWQYVGEALHMKGARYCSISDNQFRGLGGNAIYLDGDNYRNHICRNEFSDVGANGICLLGSRTRHPRFNLIEDNDIHHCGVINKFVAGVFAGVSDGNVIGHNFIHDMPHHAINLSNNGAGRNIIEYNDIRRTALEEWDTAAINCWGDVPGWTGIDRNEERSGHIIRYNSIVDTLGLRVDAEGNIVVSSDDSRGIYLDDNTANCVVYGNVIVNAGSGVLVHGGKHNVIENNLIVGCNCQLTLSDWVSCRPGRSDLREYWVGNRFCRNVCYLSRPGAMLYHFNGSDVADWEHWDLFLSQADENVFCNPVDGTYTMGWNVKRDIAFKPTTFSEWLKTGHDRCSVLQDPLFVDPEHGDFRLRPDSPALKLGFQPIDVSQVGIRKRS